MAKSNRKTKKTDLVFQKKKIFILIIIVLAALALMFLEFHPALQPMRDSLAYSIITRTILLGAILYFTWFRPGKPGFVSRIFLTLASLYLWMPFVCDSARIMLLVEMILFLVLLGCAGWDYRKKRSLCTVSKIVLCFLGLLIVSSIRDYVFVDGNEFQFWQISLTVSALAAVAVILLLIKGKIKLKDDRTSEKVFLPILIFFFSFVLVWAYSCRMNYIFDRSEPAAYSAVILDKDVHSGYRRITEYIFIANVNGKEREFYVSQSEYYHKDVGDFFDVQLYSGAFEAAYFLSE